MPDRTFVIDAKTALMLQHRSCKRDVCFTSDPAPVTLEPRPLIEPRGSKAGPDCAGSLASAKRVLSTRLSVMRQLYSRTTVCTTVSKLRSLQRRA
jgi:hypothetical protein